MAKSSKMSALRVSVLAILFVCTASVSFAQVASDKTSGLTERNRQRLWHQHWREFAKHYVGHDGEFVCFPNYSPQMHNSSGKTAAEYQKESEQAFDLGRKGGIVTLDKPKGEVEAVTRALPEYEPGAYGYIHSGMVESIVDDNTLHLKQVWILDGRDIRETKQEEKEEFGRDTARDIRNAFRDWRPGRSRARNPDILGRAMGINDAIDWRYAEREKIVEMQTKDLGATLELVGFDTTRLTEDKRWPAGKSAGTVQIAILSVDGGGFLGAEKRIKAVPASALRKGLDEEQFKKMLAMRRLTEKQFVQIVFDAKKADGREYRQAVLAAIEGWETKDESQDNAEVRDLVGENTDVDVRKEFE